MLAELDGNRRQDLLERLTQSEQAMLTTTDMDLFSPEFVKRVAMWHVHEGRLDLKPDRS